jgi:hypothetical protein
MKVLADEELSTQIAARAAVPEPAYTRGYLDLPVLTVLTAQPTGC